MMTGPYEHATYLCARFGLCPAAAILNGCCMDGITPWQQTTEHAAVVLLAA
jgi:hypothetical protein